MRAVQAPRDFERWRALARSLLAEGVEPAEIVWQDERDGQSLIGGAGAVDTPGARDAARYSGGTSGDLRVPRAFMNAAQRVLCHNSSEPWPVLYRVLWRITRGNERELLKDAADDDVHRLYAMEKAVRRDAHKMKAFVRFRLVTGASPDEGERYIAWHEPDHFIVRLTAPFFAERFSVMRWSILTPHESAHWDGPGSELHFSPGVPRRLAPRGDALEDLWKAYYANIFNPARVNVRVMTREMPRRYWHTLPEVEIIDNLVRTSARRVTSMLDEAPDKHVSAADFLPPVKAPSLKQLREASKGCQGCPLYLRGTQTVFGEGRAHAKVMLVGEQPGDQEDLAGKPFVGPAGKLLDQALVDAGIDRAETYVTNAVKHFKWEPRGKRRIHSKPNAREVRACRPWLEQEIGAVNPRIIVALGSTAAQSLFGPAFRVTKSRGKPIRDSAWAETVIATVHPSSILRAPDEAAREEAYGAFVKDLKIVARLLAAV